MLAARSGAVKARTSAINTARSLLTTAPEGLRSRFRGMGGPRLMEELPSVRSEGALGAACVPSSKNRQIRLSNFDTLMLTASGRAGAVAGGPPAA